MKLIRKELLTKKIETVEDAILFIDELHECGKIFHFDDDPLEIECFTPFEAHHVDSRTTELLGIKDWGEYEDAFGYALHLFSK